MPRLREELAVFWLILVTSSIAQTKDFTCNSNEFACANVTICIADNWRCDGENDCGDNSDEKDCPPITCNPVTGFRCTNGRCIPRRWVCDKDDDCHDGSDESSTCTLTTCSQEEITCGNGVCVPKRWLCDHDDDCGDGTDEMNCRNKTCPPNEFTCANGKCISRQWVCDQDDDCGDRSDEKHCPPHTCRPNEFSCHNKHCILRQYRCDGDNDCVDNSDELGCPNGSQYCKSSEFQCDTGKCIHKSWVCDGEVDCQNKSDERGCPSQACHPSQFTCGNNRCIPLSDKCNGKNDCLDGTDENDCPTQPPSKCQKGYFQCDTQLQCILESKVCDNKRDCSNGADEPRDQCNINECEKENGHCQHICNNTKIGYFCSCRRGYEVALDDAKSCRDINECNTPGTCGQFCENTKGSYKCTCVDGYRLEPDHRSCKALGEEAFIVFTNRQDIRRLMLDSSDYTEIVPKQRAAIAVDFDYETRQVYWTDVIDENIKVAPITNGSAVEVVVNSSLHTPDGIAVDWINRKLYWTDTGTDVIEVSDLNGINRLTLVKEGLDEPRAIVVYPAIGYMFWSDWGQSPKIERCGMNGDPKTRLALITTNILWPNGLTVDYTVDRMWWADAKEHTIESANLDGSKRRVVLSENVHHPFALTVFQDYIYWTDWFKESIHKANKFDGKQRSVLRDGIFSPMDIHIYHEQRQPKGRNPCGINNGGCSHICLLAPRPRTHTCHCLPNVDLLYDGRTCNSTGALQCTPDRCKNNGTCDDSDHCKSNGTCDDSGRLPKCKCPPTHYGERCEQIRHSSDADGQSSKKGKGMEDLATTVGIAVGVMVFILIIAVIVGCLVYRRIQRNSHRTMTFDNPVYKKTTESNSSLDNFTINFGHHNGRCQGLLSSFRNDVDMSSC